MENQVQALQYMLSPSCVRTYYSFGFPVVMRLEELPKYCPRLFGTSCFKDPEKAAGFLAEYIDVQDFVLGTTLAFARSAAYNSLFAFELAAKSLEEEREQRLQNLGRQWENLQACKAELGVAVDTGGAAIQQMPGAPTATRSLGDPYSSIPTGAPVPLTTQTARRMRNIGSGSLGASTARSELSKSSGSSQPKEARLVAAKETHDSYSGPQGMPAADKAKRGARPVAEFQSCFVFPESPAEPIVAALRRSRSLDATVSSAASGVPERVPSKVKSHAAVLSKQKQPSFSGKATLPVESKALGTADDETGGAACKEPDDRTDGKVFIESDQQPAKSAVDSGKAETLGKRRVPLKKSADVKRQAPPKRRAPGAATEEEEGEDRKDGVEDGESKAPPVPLQQGLDAAKAPSLGKAPLLPKKAIGTKSPPPFKAKAPIAAEDAKEGEEEKSKEAGDVTNQPAGQAKDVDALKAAGLGKQLPVKKPGGKLPLAVKAKAAIVDDGTVGLGKLPPVKKPGGKLLPPVKAKTVAADERGREVEAKGAAGDGEEAEESVELSKELKKDGGELPKGAALGKPPLPEKILKLPVPVKAKTAAVAKGVQEGDEGEDAYKDGGDEGPIGPGNELARVDADGDTAVADSVEQRVPGRRGSGERSPRQAPAEPAGEEIASSAPPSPPQVAAEEAKDVSPDTESTPDTSEAQENSGQASAEEAQSNNGGDQSSARESPEAQPVLPAAATQTPEAEDTHNRNTGKARWG